MSKAFVKESDQDDDDGIEAEAPVGPGGKNYITPPGFEKLKGELHQLLNVERPKLVETVAWAASNGDRSENADYIYGKRRLREIDRRIRFLTKRLEKVEVIDPCQQKADRVLFGATVTVEDEEGQRKVYKIVGIDETDAKSGKISWISPIGKALLQAKVGEQVSLRTPKGEVGLDVILIEYKTIS